MKHLCLQGAEKYADARRRKKRWYRVMSFLAAVVVFCTTYALILPAVTVENKPMNSDAAYVKSLTITGCVDGTTPFDVDDVSGNDSAENNKIVRTFDSVNYSFKVVMGLRARAIRLPKPE